MRSEELRVELPPRPASAADARRFVARALKAADPAHREIGVLLTSELVTNALLYAQGRIVLKVQPRPSGVRVAVRDGSAADVRPRRVSTEATSGRGLTLVEELATEWGVEHLGTDGKEVWFELRHPA